MRTLLATAALLVLAVTLGIQRQGSGPDATPSPAASAPPRATAPLGDGQALIWLDAETPLYMTFEAPQAPGGRP